MNDLRSSAMPLPLVRLHSLLDLPDEILIKVCGFAKGCRFLPNTALDYPRYTGGTREIQNIRLTCRRLCAASSHLLLQNITIDFTLPVSIKRLEEISLHPVIRMGVRAVMINMKFYSAELATNFQLFARFSIRKLQQSADQAEAMAMRDSKFPAHSPQRFFRMPASEVQKRLQKGRQVIAAWDSIQDGHGDDEGSEYHDALRTAHERYRMLYEDQQRQQVDQTYLGEIATAITRMPLATRLEIDESSSSRLDRRSSDKVFLRWIESYESLVRGMLAPITWREARDCDLECPTNDILIKLPIAIHKAGRFFATYCVGSSLLEDPFAVSTEDDFRDLSVAMQKLKTFSFHPCEVRDSDQWNTEGSMGRIRMRRFLSAILDTPNIETISLDLEPLWYDQAYPASNLSCLVNIREWPNLSHLRLSSIALTINELTSLLSLVAIPIRLCFDKIHLSDGRWVHGLDLLRGNVSLGSSFVFPTGAECETLSGEEYDYIFMRQESAFHEPSIAEQYILGHLDEHPLRDEGAEIELEHVSHVIPETMTPAEGSPRSSCIMA